MTFEEFLEEWRNGSDTIAACTSGSTGSPKTIELAKKFVVESAIRTNRFFSIDSHCWLHSCVAPDFIGGKMMAVRADIAGCRLTYETPSNRPLSAVGRSGRIDLLAVVPSQMIHILENLDSLPDIGNVIIGGSHIDGRLRDMIAASGINAYETYGMTETASHVALRKVSEKIVPFNLLDGISVALDSRGCLEISFDSGEHVVTNDIASIVNERSFLIEGRWDDVIITGGKKLNPVEIERRISDLISGPFIITSVPDMKWGNRMVLKIEGDGFATENLEKEMRKRLQSWQIPKEVIFVKSLDRTANGKLKRK